MNLLRCFQPAISRGVASNFSNAQFNSPPAEYDILKLFIRNADRVLTHRQIIKEVWGGLSYEDELHLLRVNISNLRRKLESDPAKPRYIITEPGGGYCLRTS